MNHLTEHTLVLEKEGKILFSSKEKGLKPLVECIRKFKGNQSSCILYDKVHGLAAAKLVVYSGFIDKVLTLTASKLAEEYFQKKGISLEAKQIVENILTADRSNVCPGEIRAKDMNEEEFYSTFNQT